MNIEEFREYCLSFKGVHDRMPFKKATYEGVQPGYHMNKKHWISVYFDKDVPDKMIKDLVKQSYEIVVSSLARREREILQAM